MNRDLFSLVKSVTEYDMNNRIEQLVCMYVDSENETFLENANSIKAEFFELWDSEASKFVF
jgi:hypothetical protein